MRDPSPDPVVPAVAPIAPISDAALAELRALVSDDPSGEYDCDVCAELPALLARLDAAEADRAERDAALASPEGVVTLDGEQGEVRPVEPSADHPHLHRGCLRFFPYQPEDTQGGPDA